MKIALMCPTRDRKNKLLTLIASLITTIKTDGVYLVLGVDEDDPIKKYYNYLQHNVPFIRVITFKNNGKFLGLSTMWNEMAKQTTDVDIYAMIGDDMTFLTQDWDVEIIKEFENGPKDNILMVHCNDGMRGYGNKYLTVAPFPVNFFIHKKYVETVGYFVEPYIENIHEDTWANLIFTNLNRKKYRHDILIKHLHVSEVGGTYDKITDNLEKLRVGVWDNNNWQTQFQKEINEELAKLKAVME